MRNTLIIVLFAVLIIGCAPTYYVTSTGFYRLNRGMTKQEFMSFQGMDKQVNQQTPVGKFPVSSETFKQGNDVWEVWIFDVYFLSPFNTGNYILGHKEHVAFKNGLLEEWGNGNLPLTIKQNPNQFQYDINIKNNK